MNHEWNVVIIIQFFIHRAILIRMFHKLMREFSYFWGFTLLLDNYVEVAANNGLQIWIQHWKIIQNMD